jgi:hypothetical protein
VIFSSNTIKIPKSSRDRAERKSIKKERKRKASRVSSNKGEVNILRGENTSTSKILFDVIPFAPPPSYHSGSTEFSEL